MVGRWRKVLILDELKQSLSAFRHLKFSIKIDNERRKTKKYFLGDCPIVEVFLSERLPYWLSIQIGNARLQIFSNAMMRQLLLHSISISYLASKIFHFFLQQIKESTQLLI